MKSKKAIALTFIFALGLGIFPFALRAQDPLPAGTAAPVTPPPPPPNMFAEHFYMRPDLRLEHETTEVSGFVFIEQPDRQTDSRYSIVTDFGGNTIRTVRVAGIRDLQKMRSWIKESLESAKFGEVEIRKLSVPIVPNEERAIFWVGHKAFTSAEAAQAEITMVQAIAEVEGGNFNTMVKEAQSAFYRAPEPVEPVVEIKSPAQQQKEEELFLKYLDAMDIGEKLWGPFQGVNTGEPIIWQSFAETTWRRTNLDNKNFNEQVGFWTNRLVFKGIRAPLNTIDPFVEATVTMETSGVDFKDVAYLIAGLEWRPFERLAFFDNYRPYGIPLLKWIKSYRLAVQYADRKNLKDIVEGSDSHNLTANLSAFYEFGVDLPPLTQGPPTNIPEYLERYVWGEYFTSTGYNMTGFSSEEDVDDWTLSSSVILGFKTPALPLPENPLTDQLVLMPYMKFEHTHSANFSYPFQNQYYVGAGVRWMPFRNYRFKDNEWLSKTKIFAEYIGIGKTHYGKQDEVSNDVRTDLRFGVSLSSRRF